MPFDSSHGGPMIDLTKNVFTNNELLQYTKEIIHKGLTEKGGVTIVDEDGNPRMRICGNTEQLDYNDD